MAALDTAARRKVPVIGWSEIQGGSGLPASSLVLVSGGLGSEAFRQEVDRLRRRYPERGWFAMAARATAKTVRAAWDGKVHGVLDAPLSLMTLESLARMRSELTSKRRSSARSAARVETLEHRLVLLSDTIQAAGSLLDPCMVSRFIMERSARLVASERWRLYRVDEGAGLLRLDTYHDPRDGTPPAAELSLDEGVAGWTARYRRIGRFDLAHGGPESEWRNEWPGVPPRLLLSVPLVSRGRVIGVAEFGDPASSRFQPAEVETIGALMEPAAIALDNAQLFRKIEERTVTDDLTGLYNARFMDNYLRREAKRAARYGHPVSLLFLDLDGFKSVNDTHGHMAGSRTLVEVGEVLRENVREIDVVARWGGDEFSVVLPETARTGALSMAKRLCRKIYKKTFLKDIGLAVRISASIGVASWPENGPSAATLLAGADTAMYSVKNGGKNGAQVAEPTDVSVLV